MKPHSPNTLILQLLGSNIIGLIKGIVGAQQWAAQHLNPALDSLSVGPKGQNHQLSAYGLKVCYQWDLPYVIFSSLKRRIVNFYLSTRTRGNQPSSLSLSKLPQHHQLTMVLYLTKNHGIWYCTCGRLIGKSSMDHWAQPRDMGIGKTWWKPMTHVHFSPKRIQGVAPWPRHVRVLLPLYCWDFRSVVWWREMSPKTLVTMKLLSLGLLGGMVASLWKPKSIEACMT